MDQRTLENWQRVKATGRLFGAAGGSASIVSGRTPEQVWDADWARANGRYS